MADTVGGVGFWDHVRNARPHDATMPGWQPQFCAPQPGFVPELDFEAENFPAVMTPWEIRTHYAFLMAEAVPHPALPRDPPGAAAVLAPLAGALGALRHELGRPARYRDCSTADAQADLASCGAADVDLRNGVRLMEALQAWVFEPAIAAYRRTVDADIRQPAAQATAVLPGSARGAGRTRGRPRAARARH